MPSKVAPLQVILKCPICNVKFYGIPPKRCPNHNVLCVKSGVSVKPQKA